MFIYTGMTVFSRHEIHTMIQIQQEEGKRQGVGLDKTLLGEEVTIIGKKLLNKS